MALHLNGTDFYETARRSGVREDPGVLGPEMLVSETAAVYRGEFLAACDVLADAERAKDGLDLEAAALQREALGATSGLVELTRPQVRCRALRRGLRARASRRATRRSSSRSSSGSTGTADLLLLHGHGPSASAACSGRASGPTRDGSRKLLGAQGEESLAASGGLRSERPMLGLQPPRARTEPPWRSSGSTASTSTRRSATIGGRAICSRSSAASRSASSSRAHDAVALKDAFRSHLEVNGLTPASSRRPRRAQGRPPRPLRARARRGFEAFVDRSERASR